MPLGGKSRLIAWKDLMVGSTFKFNCWKGLCYLMRTYISMQACSYFKKIPVGVMSIDILNVQILVGGRTI